jgi:hypothetical protein
LVLDGDFESVEQYDADQQEEQNNEWRRVTAYQSGAGNHNDRQKGPNDYVADLRVLVAHHRSFS